MKCPAKHAFSLVEVTLALGVIAFCLVAVLGLLPVSVKTNQNSQEQTSAANVVTSIGADLYAASSLQTTSKHYSVQIPAAGSATSVTFYLDESGEWSNKSSQLTPPTVAQPDSRYGVRIDLTAPTAGTRTPTAGTLFVWWPAAASLSNSAGAVSTYVAIDRN